MTEISFFHKFIDFCLNLRVLEKSYSNMDSIRVGKADKKLKPKNQFEAKLVFDKTINYIF